MTGELPRIVYVLQHARPKDDGDEDVKFIGVYSTEEAAQAAIERLRTQPGFSDYPNDFFLDAYRIDEDHWTQGFGIPWPPDV